MADQKQVKNLTLGGGLAVGGLVLLIGSGLASIVSVVVGAVIGLLGLIGLSEKNKAMAIGAIILGGFMIWNPGFLAGIIKLIGVLSLIGGAGLAGYSFLQIRKNI